MEPSSITIEWFNSLDSSLYQIITMRHNIDLHGLPHNEAVKRVEEELVKISMSKFWEIEIITGKSKPMRDKIVKEVLVPMDFFYYIPHTNPGIIIVVQDELLS